MAIIYLDRPVQPGDPVGSVYDPGRAQATNTISGTPQYSGLYGMDLTPEEETAGFLDVSKAEGTPLYDIPEFDRYSYASRNFRSLPSMYELYLSGGFPTDVAQAQDFTGGEMIDTGDAAQIPGSIDTLVAPVDTTMPDHLTSDMGASSFIDAPVGTGGDTTMPPMLTPDMGMESFVDTTPDYSNVGSEGNIKLAARGPTEMGTLPPDFVAGAQTFTDPEPSGGRLALGRADVTPEMGTIPPDTIGPQPINLIDPVPTGGRLALGRADVTPAVETVPGPFDYLQPEETYADLLERTPMNLVRTPGGEITVDPETGDVQPGTIEDVVDEPEYSVTRPAGIDTPMIDPAEEISQVAPYTDRIMDPNLMDIQQQNFEALPTEEKTNILQTAWDKAQGMGGDLMGNFQDSLLTTGKFSPSQLTSLISTIMNPSAWSVAGALGIPGMVLGGIGKALSAFEETPIDEFNREYELGGDLYQNIVSQVDDPNFEGRLQGYAGDLKSGNLTGQDPFGINTVSMLGDYPAYATETFNELATRAKQRAAEGRELSQFDKDRMEYYGHVSGLTGKTNIPETPLMADQPISLDDIIEEQEAQNELAKITGDVPVGVDAGVADVQDYADIYEPPAEDKAAEAGPIISEAPTMLDVAGPLGEPEPVTFTTAEGKTFDPSTEEKLSDLSPGNFSEDDYEKVKKHYRENPNLTVLNDEGELVSPVTGEPIDSIEHKEKLEAGTVKFGLKTATEQRAAVQQRTEQQKKVEAERVMQEIIRAEEAAEQIRVAEAAAAEQRAAEKAEAERVMQEQIRAGEAAEEAAAAAAAISVPVPQHIQQPDPPSAPAAVSTAGQAGPPSQRGGNGGGGGDGCFLKDTLVTMADGTTKSIEQVDLGDEVAKGGKVFATGKFLVDNLHDYKGIKVSGSHMVNEDGNWTRVEDSKHGKALGNDEHTVYVFGAENRRILINNILFTDYFEVNEQDRLLTNEKDFFNNWKLYAKQDSGSNVDIINAS